MLFDLRGRGRRRTVQVIYLTLALLLGGGLVLFGIGGDVQGGLFDAFREGGGRVDDTFERRVEQAEERIQANRQDAAAWADLAQAQYQMAGVSEGFDEQTGTFQGPARERLEASARAWNQHLELAGDDPNADVASTMAVAFISLDRPEDAVRAQEIIIEARDEPGYGDFARLAEFAYQAGQTRKGDLATQRAIDDARRQGISADRRRQLRQGLEQIKVQAAQQRLQEGAGAGGAGAAPGAGGP